MNHPANFAPAAGRAKAGSNAPLPGDYAAQNLRLMANGAVCGEVIGDDACAITNANTEIAPWDFHSKNADPAAPMDFPFESFFESGINLTQLIGGDVCFASFLAEDGVVKLKVNFSGTVTNTSDQTAAPVPLTNVTVTDDKAGPQTLLDGDMNPLPTPLLLEPGESENFAGSYLPDGTGPGFSECPPNAEFMDTVTAEGDDAFPGKTVSDWATAECEACPPEGCPTP